MDVLASARRRRRRDRWVGSGLRSGEKKSSSLSFIAWPLGAKSLSFDRSSPSRARAHAIEEAAAAVAAVAVANEPMTFLPTSMPFSLLSRYVRRKISQPRTNSFRVPCSRKRFQGGMFLIFILQIFSTFVDHAHHGVIIFSMGFSTKIDMPIHLFRSLMKAFSQIAQKVVFQAFIHADVKRMVDVPTNVLLVEKIPQQSLLAHEKTILFITHCGTNSVIGEFLQ